MSVQKRVRAGIMIAALGVIVSGLGYGVATGAGPVTVAGMQPVAATVGTLSPAKVTAAAVTTSATRTSTTPVSTSTTRRITVTPSTMKPAATVPTRLTMTALKSTVTQAQYYRAIFRGSLIDAKSKKPITGQKVTLYRRDAANKPWVQVLWDTSDVRTGSIFLAVEQTTPSSQYKLTFTGKSPYLASSSAIITIKRG